MKIGVIGTGNMGSILLEAFLEADLVEEKDIWVTNRTPKKALALQNKYPDIHVTYTAEELAQTADLLFICVKPLDSNSVLTGIKPYLTQKKCIVSITSPISVKQLESQISCSCARFIPSITNRALSGVSLLSFGESCSTEWEQTITELAQGISTPVLIENEVTRAASDIVSCGPAFISFLAQAFIDGAVQTTPIDKKTATLLTEKMLIGMGDLLQKGIYTLPALQEKVCVKGGITGEGIKVLEAQTGDMFNQLFEATQEKFAEDLEEIEKQFDLKY
ncbi:late competence protein ComER [Peribacillus sp. FSL H8-0477]|uniref:late competence protein ComER n=1 Tax=Peribacillus sp. FSL H8-0477 TaxID=2921388 RepID=UPI0030F7CD0F